MLSQERLYRIISIIDQRSFVTINELVERLNVSKSTVNRDLIELENQGAIRRERGGAVKKDLPITLSSYNEISVTAKEFVRVDEKKAVCRKAAETIKDNECIYIDSGSTPIYLLDYLGGKRVQLVTVSSYLVQRLPIDFRGDVYLLGGQYDSELMMNTGWLTLDMIDRFNFDQAFFSTSGIDPINGEVYSADLKISSIKEAVMKRSKTNYVLIDDSKFSVHGFCTWANAKNFTNIYTNSFPDDLKMPGNYIICK